MIRCMCMWSFFLRVLVLRDKAGGYEPMVTLCMDQNKASDVILHWGRGSYRRLFWREKKKKTSVYYDEIYMNTAQYSKQTSTWCKTMHVIGSKGID